ncbi:hypothetical protein MHLP_01405 [Candidatus Mycoplasma haematolamae str. Purdue]|uniref:Transmembrane protein n=1 Tax=Mycoplasma haematolamae (strain Purdue) TaxID=1212765 RepID=I7CF25_MYCHA|nr:hypothetical protein [Candidatus Mycoplasma haematolamae]AFO51861.1 hypothetical protein MHLP_01405 [Candidatus Mycoplasma haematolamae str. Purdue]
MLIRVGAGLQQQRRGYKPLLFFNLIPKITFSCFIGFFIHLMIIGGVLIALFVTRGAYQLFFYSGIGVIVFSISYSMYRNKYFETLKTPSYKSFLISRNKLIVWIWWTINAWMLTCWAAMISVGSLNGFGWKNQSNTGSLALCETPELTKLTGIILWVVHWFLIGVLSVSYKKMYEFFRYGQLQLRNRRAQLKQFKLKAEEEVNVQNLAI